MTAETDKALLTTQTLAIAYITYSKLYTGTVTVTRLVIQTQHSIH